MTITTDPRFDFQWGFAPGDSGWGTPYNYQARALSTLTGLYLLSQSSLTVPSSPADGDSYFVNSAVAIGVWTGQANKIASWQAGGWQFYPPARGLRAYIEDVAAFYYWSGSAWVLESVSVSGSTITSINGYTTGAVVLTVTDIPGAAPLSSPTFTGSPLTPNQPALSRDTKIANTKYVDDALAAFSVGTGYATTTYVDTAVAAKVSKSGDTMTGDLHLVAPAGADNSDKAVPSSWVRTYVTSLSLGSGTVTSVATSGAGISGGPITGTGTLTVQWNAGSVTTVGTGLSLSSGTLSATGGGTVTSVALTVPSDMTVTGSPVTGAGTLAVTRATQAANLVLAGPGSGAAAVPTYRTLVAADMPSRPYDIAVYAEGALTASEVFLRWVAPRAISIAAGASGAATASAAATGTAVINIAKNGSNFGTATYTSSATGVISITGTTALAAGDTVTFTGPASVNATLLDIAITLAATQS